MHCIEKFFGVIKETTVWSQRNYWERDVLEYREMEMVLQFCKIFNYDIDLQQNWFFIIRRVLMKPFIKIEIERNRKNRKWYILGVIWIN